MKDAHDGTNTIFAGGVGSARTTAVIANLKTGEATGRSELRLGCLLSGLGSVTDCLGVEIKAIGIISARQHACSKGKKSTIGKIIIKLLR